MQINHLLSSEDLTVDKINSILALADKIIKSPEKFSKACDGKILATLFFEPSTRTRLSHEAAMYRLGGSVIGFADANVTSGTKGETIADTIRVITSYADIIAMRHPKEGAPKLASQYATVPLINAGDGGHQHPTQTLTDLLTIMQHRQSLENMKVGLVGDLKFGRTVHSLVETLSQFAGNEFYFIAPKELEIPHHIKALLESRGVNYVETEDLDEYINDIDILYMTRVQKERFFNEADYIRLKDSYILTRDKIKNAKEDMAILHPLPRVNEIDVDVDADPRAMYFEQARYGMIVRMALILTLLEVKVC